MTPDLLMPLFKISLAIFMAGRLRSIAAGLLQCHKLDDRRNGL